RANTASVSARPRRRRRRGARPPRRDSSSRRRTSTSEASVRRYVRPPSTNENSRPSRSNDATTSRLGLMVVKPGFTAARRSISVFILSTDHLSAAPATAAGPGKAAIRPQAGASGQAGASARALPRFGTFGCAPGTFVRAGPCSIPLSWNTEKTVLHGETRRGSRGAGEQVVVANGGHRRRHRHFLSRFHHRPDAAADCGAR